MLIEPEAASLFGAIVTVSMAATPFLMMLNDWLDRRSSRRDGDDLDGPELSGPTQAIVVGYGRFGQTVAQMLMAKGISVTLIDSKPSQIEISGDFGSKVYYGDGTRLDLLPFAGAPTPRPFCSASTAKPDRAPAEPVLEAFPQAAVSSAPSTASLMELAPRWTSRARPAKCSNRPYRCREAPRPSLVGDAGEVDRVEQEYRDRDRQRLDSQTASVGHPRLKEDYVQSRQHRSRTESAAGSKAPSPG